MWLLHHIMYLGPIHYESGTVDILCRHHLERWHVLEEDERAVIAPCRLRPFDGDAGGGAREEVQQHVFAEPSAAAAASISRVA